MASETKIQLPRIDFSGLDPEKPGRSDDWEVVRAQVMHALQEYGCFEALYDEVTLELREEVFGNVVKDLFGLPIETKLKNTSEKPMHGYVGQIPGWDYESLVVNDSQCFEGVQSFTNLMWPGGNPTFSKTVWAFAKQITKLEHMVQRMVLESWGIEKHYTSHIESINYALRLSEYGAPGTPEAKVCLPAHTDTSFVSIICQHQVDGLEMQTKEGAWIHVTPTPNSFTVMLGDHIEPWSNGRLLPTLHRAVISGNKTRHIALLTSWPKDEHMVQALEELVDEEHPLLFKPYCYPDYIRYRYSEAGMKAKHFLKELCGVEGEAAEVVA